MVRVVLRFKKTAFLRFLSAIETATMVERVLRRAQLPLVFSHGYHRKPKISFIDAVPTGVADLALYVRVLLKERVSNISKAISDVSVKNLHLAGVWWTDTDPNACVDRYAFRAFLKACDVQRMLLQEDESFTREKKGQQMEFKIRDFFKDVEINLVNNIVMIKYFQERSRMAKPGFLLGKLMREGKNPILVQRTDALCGETPLNLYLGGP